MSQPFALSSDRTDPLLQEISPRIRALEQEQLQHRQRLVRQLIVLGAISVVVALVIRVGVGTNGGGLAFLALAMGAGLGIARVFQVGANWRRRVASEIVPEICTRLGELQYASTVPDRAEYLKPYEKLGVVGESTRQELAHFIRGRHRQTRFEFVHASLARSGSNSGPSTVFHGLLFRIELATKIPEPVLIGPHAGVFSRRRGQTVVTTGEAEFDQKFSVSHLQDSPTGASLIHQVMTPLLCHALMEINEHEGALAYGRGAFLAGLMHDSLYLALSRYSVSQPLGIQVERPKPFLPTGFILRPEIDLGPAVRDLIQDLCAVFRIIERLQAGGASVFVGKGQA